VQAPSRCLQGPNASRGKQESLDPPAEKLDRYNKYNLHLKKVKRIKVIAIIAIIVLKCSS
jgi:hypothetical protein